MECQEFISWTQGTILVVSSALIASLIKLVLGGSVIVPWVLMVTSLAGLLGCSIMGQLKVDMEEELHRAFYDTSWPFASRRITSCIVILMEVTKKSKRPCALGFLYYDKVAFVVIMKAAFSFYSFLRLNGERA